MFADVVAATSLHVDGHSSNFEASPVSRPFSPRRTPASSSAGSGAEVGSLPRMSCFLPSVDTSYSSPHTGDRVQRLRSLEFLSPFSPPGGCAPATTAIVSPSSGGSTVNNPSLERASESLPRRPPGGTLGSHLECHIPTSGSSSPSHHGDSAHSPPSSAPTLPRYDHEQRTRGVVSSTSPLEVAARPTEGAARPGLDSAETSTVAADFTLMRSGTREGLQQGSQSSSVLPSLSPTSTPCVPSPEQPSAGVEAVKYALAPQGPASPLQFSIFYTEEEHRVRLETHETDERRCLYQAHKAVLSVYRMWAAEDADADYGDGDRLLLPPSRRGDDMSTRFLEDRFCSSTSNMPSRNAVDPKAQVPPLATVTTANAAAAGWVRSFLSSSIDSARGRRSVGVDQKGNTTSCLLVHRSTTPSIMYAGSDAEVRRASPDHQPHPQTSHNSSPAASRMLDYSSMQMPETVASLMYTSSEPPSLVYQAKLFSPWRTARSTQQDAAAQRAEGKADVHMEPSATQNYSLGRPQRDSRTSLVPHLVSTLPAAAHRASTAASLCASSEALWRRSVLESRLPAKAAAPCTDLLRGAALPAARISAATQDPSQSLRAVSFPGVGSFSSHSSAQTEGRDASHATSSRVWNASVNRVSTSAASHHINPTTDDSRESRVARDVSRYTTSEAFRLRHLAALSSTSSGGVLRSPRDGIATKQKTLQAAQRPEDYHRERLSSYVQYKRFFDAVYGEQSSSPLSVREPDARQSTAEQASVVSPRSMQRLSSTSVNVGHRDKGASSWARRLPTASCSCQRVRSPKLIARCDVQQPLPRALTPLSDALTTFSAWAPKPAAWLTGGPALSTALADDTFFTGRLTRLLTLEKLCRAELQRRCMEDQSVLLHHFIVEGTATLQRSRRAIVPLNRHRQRTSEGRTEAYRLAPSWTFIANKVDDL
ncbi:hypothetical_protein [Leishmania braziliensis MHOM/BR/75/M2904]|uniref:Hypothetical_protein n=1 Tax=Leishmania braziliensis MHOM/BR/75/M2904 TaxID=420245 RepID=A0A3P3ZI58_LEIBR|nr:hypothetical_protein [Leishmania braziliensis MHOM/BR/75/M2904]